MAEVENFHVDFVSIVVVVYMAFEFIYFYLFFSDFSMLFHIYCFSFNSVESILDSLVLL